MQRMSVIWESEPDARLIVVLVTGYPDPHFLPLTGDPETGVFRWNLDELHEAIQGSWWLVEGMRMAAVPLPDPLHAI
jgi:hypothetical protein